MGGGASVTDTATKADDELEAPSNIAASTRANDPRRKAVKVFM
jgi:hypothetical protein